MKASKELFEAALRAIELDPINWQYDWLSGAIVYVGSADRHCMIPPLFDDRFSWWQWRKLKRAAEVGAKLKIEAHNKQLVEALQKLTVDSSAKS